MIGLKTYSGVLATRLRTTPDTLYGRIRRLSDAGLIEGAAGRGPGSGVRVTPPIVAVLVAAAMATDALAEVATAARDLADRRCDSGTCPLTGATSFGQALALIFASTGIASNIISVKVTRSILFADITYKTRGHKAFEGSCFGRPSHELDDPANLQLETITLLRGEAVRAIADDLDKIAGGARLRASSSRT